MSNNMACDLEKGVCGIPVDLQDYVNGLKQVLPTNLNIKANPQQPLSELFEKEVVLKVS